MSENVIFLKKEWKDESKRIGQLRDEWMKVSKITETELIQQSRLISNFKIQEENQNGYKIISIGNLFNNSFRQIGECFIYNEAQKENILDIALILLNIANILDEANKSAPQFEKRPGYFTNIVKEYILNSNLID